jgi:hypothetical protein
MFDPGYKTTPVGAFTVDGGSTAPPASCTTGKTAFVVRYMICRALSMGARQRPLFAVRLGPATRLR